MGFNGAKGLAVMQSCGLAVTGPSLTAPLSVELTSPELMNNGSCRIGSPSVSGADISPEGELIPSDI